MNKEITLEQLASYETAFDSDRANRIAMDAATKNGVNNAAMRFENAREMRHTFNISLEQGDITNQKQSGRCWMFAALNTMRFRIIKKLGVKTFELSQNYALFFDKLEKSNYFLESILETLNEPTAGRLVTYLLSGPLGDGGQWDMFANVVRKYGLVPKDAFSETFQSSHTQGMNHVLNRNLKACAGKLRTLGNTALAGAAALTLDPAQWQRIRTISRACNYLELSGRADFAAAFTNHLTFPQP